MPHAGRVDPHIEVKVGQERPEARAIDELALRQHGVVTRQQLLHLGLSRHTIDRLLRSGWLRPIHRGVFATGSRLDLRGQWLAAVLASGQLAVLSHQSAAALWDLFAVVTRIDVTAPRSRGPRAGVSVHRTGDLHPEDRASREGIPVTTVARTLLDLAGRCGTSSTRAGSRAGRAAGRIRPAGARTP
jgi:predicted transcriptional regulator of viral defense system